MISVYKRTCGPRLGNFGDELNRLIVGNILGEENVISVERFEDAQLVAIGSIIQDIPEHWCGIIWGTGLMFEHLQPRQPNAKVIALRGKMTARRMGKAVNTEGYLMPPVFGDPGLLADRLQAKSSTTHELGVVPHYVDYDNVDILKQLGGLGAAVKVIDPCQHPLNVLADISACQHIVSSSLHGMITAHAYGIPATWARFSDKVQGGAFKFQDYLSAFGIDDSLPLIVDTGDGVAGICNAIRKTKQPDVAEAKESLVKCLRDALPLCA